MDLVKAREVMERYRTFLTSDEVRDTPLLSPRTAWAYSHVRYMLDKMDGFLDSIAEGVFLTEGDRQVMVRHSPEWDKFNRWLGFLQGVFYITGCYTLDEMRDHNRTEQRGRKCF